LALRGFPTAGSEVEELVEAVLKALRHSPSLDKPTEKRVRKILKKLSREDLMLLANVCEDLALLLEEKLGSR